MNFIAFSKIWIFKPISGFGSGCNPNSGIRWGCDFLVNWMVILLHNELKYFAIWMFPCSFGHHCFFAMFTAWAISDGNNYAKWDRLSNKISLAVLNHREVFFLISWCSFSSLGSWFFKQQHAKCCFLNIVKRKLVSSRFEPPSKDHPAAPSSPTISA